MKMFCIRKNICSHRKKNLLFLSCNMAAVQKHLYQPIRTLGPQHQKVNNTTSVNTYSYRLHSLESQLIAFHCVSHFSVLILNPVTFNLFMLHALYNLD